MPVKGMSVDKMSLMSKRFAGGALVAAVLSGCTGKEPFVSEKIGAVEFRRSEDFAPVEIGPRRRVADRALLYAEFQVKYGVFHNYLHKWIDRPLFYDRALRPEKFAYETPDSLAVHAREMRNAGLDGLNLFAMKGRLKTITDFKDWLAAKGLGDFSVLPTLGYGDDGNRTADPEIFLQTIRMAKAERSFPRVGGKVLVPTYNYRMFKPAEHKAMLAKLDAALGKDSYAICGDVDPGLVYGLQQAYGRNGKLTPAEQASLEKGLADVLDVAGGLQLAVAEMKRPYDGQYCSLYDFAFFDSCLAPALERVYARPEYRNKVLGFYVLQGYVNHMSGNDSSEDCTGTLRRFLRSVARVNPDFLLFFEWNEVNENTMFQPTVWGGRTAARILRWHSRRLKGLPPDLFPGDDASVPPLGLTYRALAKPGEELHFEILNVPDGATAKPLRAQLVLRDAAGALVTAFPVETVDPTKFGAIDYLVKTSDLPGDAVLTPTLVVDGRAYDGFAPIRIDPTVSWNYKTVRQFLRDRMAPTRSDIAVAKNAGGSYGFMCNVAFKEPLASLELICNEDEQAACGMGKEYDFDASHIVQLLASTPRQGAGSGRLKVDVQGAKGCRFTPHYTANINSGVPVVNADGSGFEVEALFWSEQVGYFVQIPKSISADQVTIEVSRPDRKGWPTAKLPLKTLLEKGAVGAVLDDATSFRVDANRVRNLPDLPPHLKTATVNWKGVTETGTRYPVFHFRAISESGKVWRSRPIRPDAIPSGTTTLPIFDEFAKKPSEVAVPSALVPEIAYDFNPATGADLVNSWDPFYNAWLGGGTWYCEPYSDPRIVCRPGRRAPHWTEDDGRPCLKFDGVNDYVNFPKEAFPQGPFTLEMSIKPELPTNDVPMVLFRHFEFTRGSISVFIDRGRLVATWGDRDLNREPKIDSGLKVADGAWNDISISYDLHVFVFKVNGKAFSFPWEGRPFRFKPSVFGGHDKVELSPRAPVEPVYFRGLLRKIVFRHHP